MVNVIEETKERQDKRMAWWREARFGMMIHFGLYSLSGGMWKGASVPGISSWVQQRAKIPIKEYEQLAKKFNPVGFNAKEYVQLAKEVGMKWMSVTAKHHEGFCMWDTKFTDYNIVKATPFKRDPLKELAEACKEEGMRLGIYYSQTLDWHHPNGMGNKWDYVPAEQDFTKYLKEYVKPQLRELLTNYGPIATINFDMGTPTPEMAVELQQFVRGLQPDTITSGRIAQSALRIGGWDFEYLEGIGDYFMMGDNEIPDERIEGDWEAAVTGNDTWGYKSYDHNWKSAGALIQWLVAIVSRGGNYLLNVGPTPEGVIPEPAVHSLKEVGEWLKVNGESIYGATASPIPSPAVGPVQPLRLSPSGPNVPPNVAPYQCTAKRGKYYIHIFAWPWDGKLKVSGVSKEVKRVYFLADPIHGELKFNREGGDVVISVPDKAPDPIDTVVVLEINE